MADLDTRLLAAHGAGDGAALVRLYTEAADSTADPDAAAFYLTHAWIWALDTGAPEADRLRARLASADRV